MELKNEVSSLQWIIFKGAYHMKHKLIFSILAVSAYWLFSPALAMPKMTLQQYSHRCGEYSCQAHQKKILTVLKTQQKQHSKQGIYIGISGGYASN